MSGTVIFLLGVAAVPFVCWIGYMLWIATGGKGGWGP